MFGFMGGEPAETVAYKKALLKSAQEKWRFLTYFDLSTIRNKAQLATMIKIRSGIGAAQATDDVDAWLGTQPPVPGAVMELPGAVVELRT